MLDQARSWRWGTGLAAAGSVVALAGVALMAVATVGTAQLGRPTTAADAEGPALAARLAAIGDRHAAVQAWLRALNGPPPPGYGGAVPASPRESVAVRKEAEEAADREATALLGQSTAGARAVLVLERGPTGALARILGSGDLRWFAPVDGGASLPTTPGVTRREVETAGGGSLIFVMPCAPGPGGRARWACVTYEGLLLLTPRWRPLQLQARATGVGLALLLLGGAGLAFGLRGRRRERADATPAVG